jgi:hypothetical protein
LFFAAPADRLAIVVRPRRATTPQRVVMGRPRRCNGLTRPVSWARSKEVRMDTRLFALLLQDGLARGRYWLGRWAAVMGWQRVNGRWSLPAVASYFDEPPPAWPDEALGPQQLDLPLDTLPTHYTARH